MRRRLLAVLPYVAVFGLMIAIGLAANALHWHGAP